MPVPALFNSPYDRELELLKYYKGFGGNYEPVLDDPQVPRFVKTAVMIDQYSSEKDVVDYGFSMHHTMKVDDIPEWSILFDARAGDIYFRTRLNPEIKQLSMSGIDFSAGLPSILNMDVKNGGDVLGSFQSYSNKAMREFTETLIIPILPEAFFTSGGIDVEEYLNRISTQSDPASLPENQLFAGLWQTASDAGMPVVLDIECQGELVEATVSNSKDIYPVDHLHLIGDSLKGTFLTHGGMLVEFKARIEDKEMFMHISGIEDHFGQAILRKE